MSMEVIDTRYWHERYEQMSEEEQRVVNEAYEMARRVIQDHGLSASNTDPAEMLVAAITKYVHDSTKSVE